MTYSKKIRIADVSINKFSSKGHGIGPFVRVDGTTAEAEVAFTIPGDHVQSSLYVKRRGRWQGRIDQLLEASPDRIEPRCIHFATCGGCKWQQMTYAKQLEYKQSSVKEIFKNVLNPSVDFRSIVPSVSEWAYRNKMEFSFSSDLSRQKFLGLIIDASKGKVLNLTECHLVNPWFIETLKSVRKWWESTPIDAYQMSRNTGSLRTLTLREGTNTGDRMVFLTVSGNPDFAIHKSQLNSFVLSVRQSMGTDFPEAQLSIFLRIQQIAKGSPTNFYEMHLFGPDHIEEKLEIQSNAHQPSSTFKFIISPTAFFQPNTKQAERFYSLALQMADINQGSVVYDLYCGTGTLGICSSKIAKEVVGVEISREAALDARQNAALNGAHNVTIIAGEVRHVLNQIQVEKKLPAPDVVLVDPPRAGLDPDSMLQLIQLNSPKILYISCNPSTQITNVEELMQHGYQVKIIQPIDQFPQTVHIENLVLLIKNPT